MPFKARIESDDLKRFKILNGRMELTADEKRYLSSLIKGFEGEVKFDLLTEKLNSKPLILNDLLLEVGNTKFQIDSSLIFQETLHFFEVKNHEGDYIYDPENFRSVSGNTIQNPLDQLKRSKVLLRQLLKNLGYNLPIEGHVVFINPEFLLYNAPPELPFIFSPQINRFMKKLDTKSSKINQWHMKIASQLAAMHLDKLSLIKLPSYQNAPLIMGPICKVCNSFFMSPQGHRLLCNDCGCSETAEIAVLRYVEELKLLFPLRKITTNELFYWCGGVISKKRICKILGKYLQVQGVHQWTFFE
ncbi:nuclease-related domain-containing protein [Bacillus sp. UNC438CL73TsuS30]|uniref:nuclease-related domain-containing protein n=1 Tax=Bacillus sp. UNC438CL73TsuS30 TaxID=1340434 RepID=UPI00047868CA|nr:nuclease-related domain-containing protein [Bacillus sp. UNC438CL73TsuS30]